MQMNRKPISELRTLLSAVSEHGDKHLMEVEADLQQIVFLLNEAIEKLVSSFSQVNALVEQQQALLVDLDAQGKLTMAEAASLNRYKLDIGNEINAVVTGMQFQDMTNQLLQRNINRVNGLKDLLQALAEHGHEMDADKEHEDISRFLEDIHHNLHTGSHALSGNLRKVVGQKDLTSGDIDLF